ADGTYLIEASATPPDTVGLRLAAYDVPPDLTATLTVGGPPVEVVTVVPGQRAQLTFEGRAGQPMRLVQRGSGGRPGPTTRFGCLNEDTRLLRADGQVVAATNSCAPLDPTPLPVSGTYTIEVHMIDTSTADLSIELYEAQ